MNICLVTNEFPALTETFITTKALELNARGHQITIIRNHVNNQLNVSHIPLVKKAGIKVYTFPELQSKKEIVKALLCHPLLVLQSFSLSRSGFKKRFRQQLQKELLKGSFDIIHFEFSGLAIAYQNTLDNLRPKLAVSCRGTAEKVKPVSDPQRKEQLKKVFSLVDAIHCVSHDMFSTILPYCDEPQKIFVNRPSIDPIVFKRSKPYTSSNTGLQLLTIGRFTFQKGFLLGLLAMHKLKSDGLLFNWTIVGDGPLKEEIMYHIHALKLDDCVDLAGKKERDEVLALYNEVDIFLLPSIYEGIANVCLEAMSMELPVVSTKSGGMEEVIIHKENGLLCEVYDPSSIAENIRFLADNNIIRKELGERARKTIIEGFTITRQVDVFEEKYSSLVSS